MHSYSINTKERKIILFFLALLSILIIYLISLLNINFPWFIGAPSAMTIYFLLFYFFNNYLWNFNIFKKIQLVKTSNLNGEWKGYLTTSYDNHKKETIAFLEIKQNWTEIAINFSTEKSFSKSNTASFIVNGSGEIILTYTYLNEPLPNTPESMNIHYGTTILRLKENKLEGQYFNGSGRENIGEIYLEKVE